MRKIVPQTQANRHRPEEGLYGDCHRTAIAVLLGRDRDEVPHFAHDDPGSQVFQERVKDWLQSQGMMEVSFIFNGTDDLGTILTSINTLNPGVPFLLGGRSRTGVNHTVVCQDGEIACDPSQTGAGIIGPTEPDGFYWVTFIVARHPYAL